MARILVTGASGFIGQHLARHLAARGDRVRCLVRRRARSTPEWEGHCEPICGDLGSPESLAAAVQNVDVVYHLAGLTAAVSSRALHAVNGQGTATLMQACAQQTSPPVVVHVSSLAAMGPSRSQAPRREGDRPAPVSHYGRSKLASELAVRALAHCVPTTIVRPAIVFGPGDRGSLPMFQSIACCGIHALPGIQLPRLAFIHVFDLVHLLALAAERGTRVMQNTSNSNASAGCYFAAAPEQPHWLEFGRMLARAVGRRLFLPLFLPSPLLWTVGLVNEGVSQMNGRATGLGLDKVREALAGNWTASPAAAACDLGFLPAASLEQRLLETATWYRAAGWLTLFGSLPKAATARQSNSVPNSAAMPESHAA